MGAMTPVRAVDAPRTGPIEVVPEEGVTAFDRRWRRAAEITGLIAVGLLIGAGLIPW